MSRPGVGKPLRQRYFNVGLTEKQWRTVISLLPPNLGVRRSIVRQLDRRVHNTFEAKDGDR